jgi:hypothetical protein
MKKELRYSQIAFQKTAQNFPNLGKDMAIQVPVFKTPKRYNQKRPTPCHIIVKMSRQQKKEY